jgi:hypothetical protein
MRRSSAFHNFRDAKGDLVHIAGTQNIEEWGWRLSLGLAAVPAVILTLGGALLPETPNSLVERGHHEQVRACSGFASHSNMQPAVEKRSVGWLAIYARVDFSAG